jgi:hypothetical protein
MQIKKAIVLTVGLGAEICLLSLITKIVFWRVLWQIDDFLYRLIDRYIHSEAAAWISIDVIFLISLAVIILLIKSKHLRNPFVIVLAAWFLFLLNGIAFFSLLLPFMHKG